MSITGLSASTKTATPVLEAGPARDPSATRNAQAPERLLPEADTDAISAGKPVAEPEKEDPAALKKTVDDLNAAMKQRANSIEFSIDEDSGKTIVKVMDTESNTVLKQYPSRELLAIAKQIDQFQGMFVKTKA